VYGESRPWKAGNWPEVDHLPGVETAIDVVMGMGLEASVKFMIKTTPSEMEAPP